MKGFFLERPLVQLADEDFFMKLVRDAFAQRRKMLINNLKKSKLLERVSDVDLKRHWTQPELTVNAEAKTLSVEEFGHLSNICTISPARRCNLREVVLFRELRLLTEGAPLTIHPQLNLKNQLTNKSRNINALLILIDWMKMKINTCTFKHLVVR